MDAPVVQGLAVRIELRAGCGRDRDRNYAAELRAITEMLATAYGRMGARLAGVTLEGVGA
jgi:hypothetical protein